MEIVMCSVASHIIEDAVGALYQTHRVRKPAGKGRLTGGHIIDSMYDNLPAAFQCSFVEYVKSRTDSIEAYLDKRKTCQTKDDLTKLKKRYTFPKLRAVHVRKLVNDQRIQLSNVRRSVDDGDKRPTMTTADTQISEDVYAAVTVCVDFKMQFINRYIAASMLRHGHKMLDRNHVIDACMCTMEDFVRPKCTLANKKAGNI